MTRSRAATLEPGLPSGLGLAVAITCASACVALGAAAEPRRDNLAAARDAHREDMRHIGNAPTQVPVMSVTQIRASERSGARAMLRDLEPLAFAGGADERADYPSQVRAGSAVRRWGAGLVVIQDDVNVLALRDLAGQVTPLLLPRGADGRRRFDETLGNKKGKLDLESALVLPDGRLVALGSGSKRRRERIVLAWPDGQVELREAHALYRLLRDTPDFAGSELNIEGAIAVDGRMRLFQRGNGAPSETRRAVSATADFALADWVRWLDGQGGLPPILDIVQYDLGAIAGVPLGFTDAAVLPSGAVAFLACAERSPDAVQDGEIVGCRVGIVEGRSAWTSDIRDPQGEPVRLKLEGIEPLESDDAGTLRFVVVTDQDDPDAPALIGNLDLSPGDGGCCTERIPDTDASP